MIADARSGPALTATVRARRELASAHVIVCVALDSPVELRAALDAGADDVMRVPFEPEVLAARVAAGLRAARLRAGEALLRSLVSNIPGVVYRCACDEDWTMQWLSDEIEEISGYPADEFIDSAVRTFASVIHPDDREQVERSVRRAVEAGRPFTLEYRIVRRDGDDRWVLERGQAQEAGDGRRWLDGAIFDITARRAAEQALREREIVEAQLAEVRASRARILEAADRARHEIERNLHDGAQQRFVSVALQLQAWVAGQRELSDQARAGLDGVLGELRAGLAELRDLAHGLHPAVLSDRGLEHALSSLAYRAAVPVELRAALPDERLPISVEAAAYFTVCEALTNVAKYAGAESRLGRRRASRRPARRRGRRRRHRRCAVRRRLGPARTARPRRGGQRHARGRQPARWRHGREGAAAGRSRLRSDRRRPPAHDRFARLVSAGRASLGVEACGGWPRSAGIGGGLAPRVCGGGREAGEECLDQRRELARLFQRDLVAAVEQREPRAGDLGDDRVAQQVGREDRVVEAADDERGRRHRREAVDERGRDAGAHRPFEGRPRDGCRVAAEALERSLVDRPGDERAHELDHQLGAPRA